MMIYERCKTCPLYRYCITQKKDHDSCADMVSRYNANLLIPPELIENSSF
jgi:hypothetical protein